LKLRALKIAYLFFSRQDELADGKKYFKALVFVSVIGVLGFWFAGKNYIALTFGFIFIVGLISLMKRIK